MSSASVKDYAAAARAAAVDSAGRALVAVELVCQRLCPPGTDAEALRSAVAFLSTAYDHLGRCKAAYDAREYVDCDTWSTECAQQADVALDQLEQFAKSLLQE